MEKTMKTTTKIYKEMRASGIMPDENTYNILIRGHCRARNMKEACYFHSEMIGKGFSLSRGSYNALIKGLVRKKRLTEATQLFEEMRAKNLVANREICNIFIDINYTEQNIEMTLELCDEAIEKCLPESDLNKI